MTAGGLEPTIEADYTFAHDEPFALAGGGSLQPVTLRYALYGDRGGGLMLRLDGAVVFKSEQARRNLRRRLSPNHRQRQGRG